MTNEEIGKALAIGLVVVSMIGSACTPILVRRIYGIKVMVSVFTPLYVIVALYYLFSLVNPPHVFDVPFFLIWLLSVFIFGILGTMLGFIFELTRWLYFTLVQ